MKEKTVLVVGNSWPVRQIFSKRNFRVLSEEKPEAPDIVCFTGGSDITPAFYNQQKLSYTRGIDKQRDINEKAMFNRYPQSFKVGICRGAQLLNVLSGGNMYQHVDNHQTGYHTCIDLITKKKVTLNTVHHQMMVPGNNADVICIANESTYRHSKPRQIELPYDPEVIWYEKTKSLCFQAHPEYINVGASYNQTEVYFFELLSRFFMDNVDESKETERKVG